MIVPGIPFVHGRNDYTDTDGRKYGICIHNTSNDATAEGEASYATRRTDGTSSHFYGDNDSVVQSLDTAHKAGHAGSTNANENAIAVEITGRNEKTREWWLANVAWDLLGRVLAAVIRHHWPDGSFQVRRATVAEMKANPKVKAFYSHDDCRLAWGGTTHDDPGPNFPWDKLFTAVNAALGTGDDMALSDSDAQALIWRVEALVNGRDTVNGGPLKGEKVLAWGKLAATANAVLAARLDAILAAAKDAKNTDVVLDPAALADLEGIRDAIAGAAEAVRPVLREEIDKTKLGS